jgi:predicted NAD/FAD-dependent oxidoreductase
MIHGKQIIKLTTDSVREALNDWLQKHLVKETVVTVTTWDKTANEYNDKTLTIEFEQVQ